MFLLPPTVLYCILYILSWISKPDCGPPRDGFFIGGNSLTSLQVIACGWILLAGFLVVIGRGFFCHGQFLSMAIVIFMDLLVDVIGVFFIPY